MFSKLKPALISLAICLLLVIIADKILGLIFHADIVGSTQDVGVRIDTIEADRRNYTALTFGDSVLQQVDQMRAQNVPGEDKRLLPLGTRFVTTIIGNYFLFKRYLQLHPPPEVVVIGSGPNIIGLDIDGTRNRGAEDAVFRTFTNFDEIFSIYEITGDRTLAYRQLGYGLFNFTHLLPTFRRMIEKVIPRPKQETPPQVANTDPAVADWKTPESNLNFFWRLDSQQKDLAEAYALMTSFENECPADAFKFRVAQSDEHQQRYGAELDKVKDLKINFPLIASRFNGINFCVYEAADRYLKKFIELAAASGTRLVYTPNPIPESYYKMWVYSGLTLAVDYYFSELEKQYANFYYVHDHVRHLPDDHFSDLIHFGPQGIQYFRDMDVLFSKRPQSNLDLAKVFTGPAFSDNRRAQL